ncbi:MAG: hypothetical protein QF890_17340 [Myxococcota bacterium]|nr:hypothetical protein [Deltaproteobacteria bacterium]MCP4242748.1 hypothetical protein [bacterium]MDP7075271.1 hypothetical protein [Myxococcota bacterium]MDP7299175.1 hypothetical protein [Myxococcota bacterium]MDP7434325.1 hypothetical protein [Myxococcota bacterium]
MHTPAVPTSAPLVRDRYVGGGGPASNSFGQPMRVLAGPVSLAWRALPAMELLLLFAQLTAATERRSGQ